MTYIIYHVLISLTSISVKVSLIFFHCLQWIPPWILKSLSKSLWFLWFFLVSTHVAFYHSCWCHNHRDGPDEIPEHFDCFTFETTPRLEVKIIILLVPKLSLKSTKTIKNDQAVHLRCTEQPFLFFFQVVVRTQKFFYLILSLKNILWCCGRRFLELV